MNAQEMVRILTEAGAAYHNGTSIMSDSEYDTMYDELKRIDPKNPFFAQVGSEVTGNHPKVTLPYYMGSMNKITTDDKALQRWFAKHTPGYVVTDKLDGISALFVKTGASCMLYTRGNGTVGSNISKLLKTLPQSKQLCDLPPCVIRGELIMSKQVFAAMKSKAANARNMVAGVVNAKRPQKAVLSQVRFVAYEVIEPAGLAPSQQMAWLHEHDIECVHHSGLANPGTAAELSTLLLDRRTNGAYEVDGIIVSHDHVHPRKAGENPKHAFAFKSAAFQDSAETHVLNVEWNVSKDGYLIPRIEVAPIRIGGVTVRFATGHNAKNVLDQGIGKGAKVEIIRSGDVIPKVSKVLSKVDAAIPETIAWKWDATKTHAVVADAEGNDEIAIKQVIYFFNHLSIKSHGIKESTIRKMYAAGYDTPAKIIAMKRSDVASLPGFKDKSVQNMLDSIERIKASLNCLDLMVASGRFGRGLSRKRIIEFDKAYPNAIFNPASISAEDVMKIKGFAKTTADSVVKGLRDTKTYLKEEGLMKYCSKSMQAPTPAPDPIPVAAPHPLVAGKGVLFSGFRSDDLSRWVTERGGTMKDSYSKQVHLVVYTKESAKVKKAIADGAMVLHRDEFEKNI